MQDLLGIGTNRRESMIGVGFGLGLSEFRLATGPAFSPDSISGLQVWLDASDQSTLYQSAGGSLVSTDGDPVGEWRDKSGNSRHHTQASGTNKPAFKAGIKNGKNAVRFDGVNDSLSISSTTFSQPFTIFAVARRGTSGNGYPFLYADYGASLFTNISDYPAGGGLRVYAGSAVYTSAIGANSWKVVGAVFNGSSSTIRKNSLGVTGNAGNQALQMGVIGRSGDNDSGAFWDGDVAEILFYNSALSSQNISNVEAYLNSKWGVF